jgi:phosphatidate phosphatase APP1
MNPLARILTSLAILGALPVGCPDRQVLGAETSPIRSDEEVVFYPTYGRLSADGSAWHLAIHGSIFEPEPNSAKRAAALAVMQRALGLPMNSAEAKTFERRMRAFLVDHERGKRMVVRLGSQTYVVGRSEPNGHFSGEIRLAAADAQDLLREATATAGWLPFEALTRPGDKRRFPGRVQLIGPTGLSVVSDVDDTIKISQVRDRKALLANTFLRPFRPVPGMPAAYRQLAAGGATFHYLSASPWQLYEFLAEFLKAESFPPGTFHLKYFRLTDSTFWNLFTSQEDYKSKVLEELLAAFPKRRFLLVGDTGEQDPEIFARMARAHPEQVVGIWLRNVTEETESNPRITPVKAAVRPEGWKLFAEPGELKSAITEALRLAPGSAR